MAGPKWTQSQPIPSSIWAVSDIAYHLNIDPTRANTTAENNYLTFLQQTAVESAEEAMNMSLLTRTIVAQYFGPQMPWSFGYAWGETYYMDNRNKLRLPRGPVQSITSITDANGTISPNNYSLEAVGVRDYVRINVGWTSPLTITYVAGWGNTASAIPADIQHAIRLHVGTLYQERESIGVGKSADPIPHSLADFYRLKSRSVPVG